MSAFLPDNEAARLETLNCYNILDTPAEEIFDDITRLASTLCGTPIGLITLLDGTRQWFKSRVGVEVMETQRDLAFCSHAILQPDLFIVPNALEDERFADNPFVTSEAHIRFYAGVPLITPSGHALGTLCVVDKIARDLSAQQQEVLRVLARQVVAQLELRRIVIEQERAAVLQEQMKQELRQTQARFEAFMNTSPVMAFMKDAEGHFVYVNKAFERHFDTTLKALSGTTDFDWLPKEIAEANREVDEAVLASGQPAQSIDKVASLSGELATWMVHKFPFNDLSGKKYVGGVALDITERVETEERVRSSEARFRAVIEGSMDAFFLLDSVRDEAGIIQEFIFVEMNLNGERLLLKPRQEVLGRGLCEMLPVNRTEGFFEKYVQVVETRQSLEEEFSIECDGIATSWLHHQVVPVEDGIAIITRDVTQRRQMEDQIQEQMMLTNNAHVQLMIQAEELAFANTQLETLASTDGLTGLKNHRTFQERLAEELERSQRHNLPLSLLMLDVDQFKTYNDTFGHPAGDLVLKTVARLLQEHARGSDFVARYGGEEFVVLLPQTDAEGAMRAAERFRLSVESYLWKERSVTISIGATTLRLEVDTQPLLIARADKALYQSKRQGRNRVTHAEDPEECLALESETSLDEMLQRFINVDSGAFTADARQSNDGKIHASILHAYDATVESWCRIVDLKDKETKGHSERVTDLMIRLAGSVGMTAEEAHFAWWGALLHDIGKIGIKDAILLKPGPLTEEEWVLMRCHPVIAYDMLSGIGFLQSALDIPFCHHEKWDGTGYPRGLCGEQIPRIARLFAVIDVYDALKSDRPYRKGWSETQARDYLREQSGKHFDPSAVQAFLHMLQEGKQRKVA